ncbi:hypothetical protein ACVWXM_008107 [Bradyrhizobium sp. GM7.3]|jgi:hypothetical protein
MYCAGSSLSVTAGSSSFTCFLLFKVAASAQLLDVAKQASERLELWTFQRNALARRFYQARGFTLIEQTDGARNEEKEPDARYLWMRADR